MKMNVNMVFNVAWKTRNASILKGRLFVYAKPDSLGRGTNVWVRIKIKVK